MPDTSCKHCGTPITDRSTMQIYEGETYCCRNCVAMINGTLHQPGLARCFHCESPIMDATTKVDGAEGRTFCCNNCAVAMAEEAAHKKR
jgi:hypothetical protein